MKERRRERLHSRLRLATATIKDNPTTFFEHKDFLALTDMLSDMSSSAAIRMKVSIPASYLHNTEKLNSLPLPVTIEKATRYIEGSGANIGDEIVVFDWFSMEDAQDRETANLIGDFVGAIVRAFNGKTASPATTSTPADEK